LRGEIERLIAANERAEDFLEPPSFEAMQEPLQRLSRDLAGTQLGEFVLIEPIDSGASGMVWRAHQTSLSRDVAVKVLGPHLARSDETCERFHKEARAASRLHHPNVVTILTVGREGGAHFIAMEYVEGRSLQSIVADSKQRAANGSLDRSRRSRDFREAARIVAKIARGLQHCHGLGVVHRDIKPQNIVVDAAGEPRIVDFGIARDLFDDVLGDVHSAYGTLHYMSPEQIRARRSEIDFRTDVYSLGALLYELLTLQRPFERTPERGIPHAILHTRPRPPHDVDAHIPEPLSNLCMKALRKSPALRYGSAEAMARELERWLRGARPTAGARVREAADILLHRKPWFVATAAVALAGLFLYLTPAIARLTSGSSAGSLRVAQTEPPPTPAEIEADLRAYEELWKQIGLYDERVQRNKEFTEKERRRLADTWRHNGRLIGRLSDEKIYHDDPQTVSDSKSPLEKKD
jgi:tRNA A-37 threonylcarbamoyl transferase component Bud32